MRLRQPHSLTHAETHEVFRTVLCEGLSRACIFTVDSSVLDGIRKVSCRCMSFVILDNSA